MSAAHRRLPNVSLTSYAQRVSVGAGFVALDMLLVGKDRVRANEQYAGGSCGNVLTILSHLSWSSYPVARLGTDHFARNVIEDFQHFGVNTNFVFKSTTGVTPVIVVRLAAKDNGKMVPRFEWKHPQSGAWLPRYRPFPKRKAEEVVPQLPTANIFFFDRAEKSSLLMAEAMRARGAVIFFEPSSYKTGDEVFISCLEVSDIVKYSAERISLPPPSPIAKSPRLEIQTKGGDGLRYRLKEDSNLPGPWQDMPAFPVDSYVDSTGCGDWCSAGIIDTLCHGGRDVFAELGEHQIREGLRYGQALAAVNCQFQGARGPMYHLSHKELLSRIDEMLSCDKAVL